MTERLEFFSNRAEWGELSNFSRHPFTLDGRRWPTSEHYFQAQKFAGTEHEELVRQAKSPMDAARLGRDRSRPLRQDWERVKDDVMRRAVRAKFMAHPELIDLLRSTGDAELVEAAPNDHYWGAGADGTGKNMLGKILMEVRAELCG